MSRKNKLKSLKVAQSKDDGGGGLVDACMNGCDSDGLCDDVHNSVCDDACDGVCDGEGEGCGYVE